MMTEMEADRGFVEEKGQPYLNLDLTQLSGRRRSRKGWVESGRYAMKFRGIDPVEKPLPVKPVCHYTMGGIDVDIDGATSIGGLWAAGEAACVSINGANRLGANSTAECLVWGRITGEAAARHALDRMDVSPSDEQISREEKHIFDEVFHGKGGTNPYQLRDELQSTMDKNAFVFRTGEGLAEAVRVVRRLKSEDFLHCDDSSRRYNTNLTNVLEVESMLLAAEAFLVGALARTESRGAHTRRDFPNRDDANWLKHTLAFNTPDGVKLGYSPVRITRYQPAERTY